VWLSYRSSHAAARTGVIAVELSLVIPEGPRDARQLVGDGGGSLIGMRRVGRPERPGLQLRERLIGLRSAPGRIES
jgi:hypothetical protein